MIRTLLATPALPRLTPPRVFDGFGWCESQGLLWGRRGAGAAAGSSLTAQNPPGMIFVMRESCSFLPRELASLHAAGAGLEGEWALAPYAIDDATDELYARRVPPSSLLWLWADDLPALFWGLHDWAHFHNHGPFEERAWTELQCDTSALAWLWLNRRAVELSREAWLGAVSDVSSVAAARFADEGLALPAGALHPDHLVALAGSLGRSGASPDDARAPGP